MPSTHPRISPSPCSPPQPPFDQDHRAAATYLILRAALHALESRYSVGRRHVLGHGLVVGLGTGGVWCVLLFVLWRGGGESFADDGRGSRFSSMSPKVSVPQAIPQALNLTRPSFVVVPMVVVLCLVGSGKGVRA